MSRWFVIGFTADDIVGGGQDVRLAAAYARARQGTEEPVDARIVQAPGDRDHVLVWFVDEAAARILDAAGIEWRRFVVGECAAPPSSARGLIDATTVVS